MAVKSNEMFEMLVKITGDNSIAKKTLSDLKKEVKDLESQMKKTELGSKQFEEVKGKVVSYRRAIQDLSQPMDTMRRSTKSAANVTYNLNRVIQDMPYGIMGVANNIDILQESFIRLRKEQGGAKAAFSALMGAMTGPTGIMLGISAVTALVVAFGDDLLNAILDVNDELAVTLARLGRIGDTDYETIAEVNQAINELNSGYDAERRNKLLSKIDEGIVGADKEAINEKAMLRLYVKSGYTSKAIEKQAEKMQEAENRLNELVKSREALDFSGVEKITGLQLGYMKELGVWGEKDLQELEAQVEAYNKLVGTRERITQDQEREEERLRKEGVENVRKYLAAAKKREQEVVASQESLYSSMISNVEAMISKDMNDLDVAKNMLLSGPLAERYGMLLRKIERTVPQIADGLIQNELNTIYQKLVEGKKLTGANLKFLELQGVLSKRDAGFLGIYNTAAVKASGEKDGGRGKELRTFRKYRAENAKSMENIGEQFEDTAVDAFEQSVSLFSAQLAAAIMQGGYTFSEILSNVATMFGQLLLQFIIEAFAQEIAGSFLKVIGLAEGTPAAPPGYTWVGEKGPELVRFQGGEEVVPSNQVGRRLDALYSAGLAAQDFGRSGDVSGIINALDRQTRAMLKDRLNYEITDRGSRQIARATKKREGQIRRYNGG